MVFDDSKFQFLIGASRNGTFGIEGYSSDLIPYMAYSVVNVNYRCSVPSTLTIFQYSSENDTHQKTVFQTSVSSDTNFFKRFVVKGMFFSIAISNDSAPSVIGNIQLCSTLSQDNQFASSTLLNSNIGIVDDTSLMRLGNNYEVDLVRGIHTSFEKVNVKGFLSQANPSNEETIGLEGYNFVSDTTESLWIGLSSSDDGTFGSGTGAQSVRIIYVDTNGDEQETDYTIGSLNPTLIYDTGIDARAVKRMFVLTTGSAKKNVGEIVLSNTSQTITFAKMEPAENTTQMALYYVPNNKRLIVRDINLSGTGKSGVVKVYERDWANGINYTVGAFRINTTLTQITYTLDALLTENFLLLVNFVPDSGASATQTDINVNINGVLCPEISSF